MRPWNVLLRSNVLLPLLLAASAAIAIAAMLPYGMLNLTYDSYDLIAASKSLTTYLTEKNQDGHSYLLRAPLHPFILSFFENKRQVLWIVNAGCLAGSGIFLFTISRTLNFQPFTAGIFLLAVFSFYPWLINFQFFWTEPVFILLILALTFCLLKNYHVAVIILICALLFLARKPGIFFFPAAALLYWYDKKFLHGTLLMGMAVIIFISWQVLEYSFDSTGYAPDLLTTENSYLRVYYFQALTSWFLPHQIPFLVRLLTILLAFVLLVVMFRDRIFLYVRARQNVVLFLLAFTYSVLVIISRGAAEFGEAERYLSVVAPLWIAFAILVFRNIYLESVASVRLCMIVSSWMWLTYSVVRTTYHLL